MFCICIEIKMENPPPLPLKIFFLSNWDFFFVELGKKHTFWHWEWGRISTPKSEDQEPWFPTLRFLGLYQAMIGQHPRDLDNHPGCPWAETAMKPILSRSLDLKHDLE